ncbi:indole-3-glycerol-phosphate synthase [Halorubellus sp. JP-L1]|uniref:indole-3-glycerol phosphate synthase n=1 Tax=Halorubellus sp. JP-L1 TaxID=2715753 RepID=UPI00140AD5EC|nr:indole-3-glycerol phosphate synthase [Halorubellus sp. JP-L1]NHN42386.1 indole-3-glycerol-phosphate synthase [Halorubellus sp. JP-L1]
MNTRDGRGLAPAVEAILDAARDREVPTSERVDVDARSLPDAFDAAEADGRTPIIAEVKPTSPTTDGTREDDPVALAREMVDGGAAALSVLTEPEHFGGSTDALAAVRDAVDVPVLRKDFLLRERDLDAVEADVVLLIARFLGSSGDDDTGVEGAAGLETMLDAARDRGFQALVEVHTEAELERALLAGATLVGVNNRDLARLEVDLGTFERVADAVPAGDRDGVTLIAESGVGSTEDVARMRRAGADGLLVGSAIMDGDVRANTRRLTAGSAADPTENTR